MNRGNVIPHQRSKTFFGKKIMLIEDRPISNVRRSLVILLVRCHPEHDLFQLAIALKILR